MIKFLRSLTGNELDRLLKRYAKEGRKSFLIPWNRGLGDIALGLYTYVLRIKTFIPDAQITFITRDELVEGFRLLGDVDVIGVPWQRGFPVDLAETLKKLAIEASDYDEILEKVNPTKWLSWQIGRIVPKLKWETAYDSLHKRFNLDPEGRYVGVHVSSETGQFYKYRKDWPLERWQELLKRITGEKNLKVILFGNKKDHAFESPHITDLRGDTGLLEMLSIIKNRCCLLIAPDGGVLSITYYLDTFFDIKVISLWGDARQGVLKQGVRSPNAGLKHVAIKGAKGNVSGISVETVLAEI
jgi:ADP-heptose:LPS heptosyltransferase